MNRAELTATVMDCLRTTNMARPADSQIPLEADTPLFGSDGHLDSMGLVSLLLDIEDALLDEGYEVALSDERAMSQARSPFRSVATLTDYIEDLLSARS